MMSVEHLPYGTSFLDFVQNSQHSAMKKVGYCPSLIGGEFEALGGQVPCAFLHSLLPGNTYECLLYARDC